MHLKGRRKFHRLSKNHPYRKMFIIAMEGAKTEPEYFKFFNGQYAMIRVKCLKGGKDSSPLHVLKRMEKHLKEEGMKVSDEAWLVIDKDHWTDDQLTKLNEWADQKNNYGLALSNPKFEFWLLLHFENSNGVTSSRICSEKLERHLPGYDKGVDIRKITDEMVASAINRAKNRDNPPCDDWPRTLGTTVYKLVENILKSQTDN